MIVEEGTSWLMWQGAGPVDGDPTTASSKCLEWFGMAGLLEVLTLFETLYPTEGARSTVQIYVDNHSVVQKLPYYIRSSRKTRHVPNDVDIISHALQLWNNLETFHLVMNWVKAHQDDSIPFEELPLKSQLKVCAD